MSVPAGFTPDELCLPFPEWKALAEARRPHLDPVTRQWLAAWGVWDLHCSPMSDDDRRLIRYGHYLGWLDRQLCKKALR